MSLISPTLAERREQARQAQLRAQKTAADGGWRQGKNGRRDRYARWHVEEAAEQDSENWLLSYLDLITLLLALLVVLLALTRLHGQSIGHGEQPVELVGTLAASGLPAYDGEYSEFDAVHVPASWAELPAPEAAPVAVAATAHAPAAAQEGEVVAEAAPPLRAPSKESLGLADLGNSVDVIVNEQSVSFRISNELLFPSGQATLRPASSPPTGNCPAAAPPACCANSCATASPRSACAPSATPKRAPWNPTTPPRAAPPTGGWS
jgi:chemotaxis protein MotB